MRFKTLSSVYTQSVDSSKLFSSSLVPGFSGFASNMFNGFFGNKNHRQHNQQRQQSWHPPGTEDTGSLLGVAVLLLLAYGVYKLFLSGNTTQQGQDGTHPGYPRDNQHAAGPPPPGFKPDFTGRSCKYVSIYFVMMQQQAQSIFLTMKLALPVCVLVRCFAQRTQCTAVRRVAMRFIHKASCCVLVEI